MTLHFETDPASLTPEVIRIIARAPTRFQLFFGLQSINEETVKRSNRPLDLPAIEANLRDLKRAAPTAQFMFSIIYGLPGDTLASFRKTVDWALQWRPQNFAALQLLMLPGADLSHAAPHARLDYQRVPPYQVYETDAMSRQDIARARELVFYSLIMFDFKALAEILFDEVLDPGSMAEGSRIRLIEEWIEHLRAQGIDLTCGLPILTTDEHTIAQRALVALEIIKADKLMIASILHTTRRFAERFAAAPA